MSESEPEPEFTIAVNDGLTPEEMAENGSAGLDDPPSPVHEQRAG